MKTRLIEVLESAELSRVGRMLFSGKVLPYPKDVKIEFHKKLDCLNDIVKETTVFDDKS
ncbi:MAG: hypothetical protein P9M13_05230 [Candidatus Ancaeobacter aquaticus]|nr:hypothetical protein [Candidatus Ancaeobacter aquaticus]